MMLELDPNFKKQMRNFKIAFWISWSLWLLLVATFVIGGVILLVRFL